MAFSPPLRSPTSELRGAKRVLLFGFFTMGSVLAARRAMLFQLQLVGVLAAQVTLGVIVIALAIFALQADEIVLAHIGLGTSN